MRPYPIVAVQYKETSRRAGKYADIVAHNSAQIAAILKVPLREATIPNGTKEGAKVLLARVDGHKLVIPLSHWLIVEDQEFKVYSNADFLATFTH